MDSKLEEFRINVVLRGFGLTFKTTYDLFSYRKIDEGTELLVEALEVQNGQQCLDLGCGYGPVGIVMSKLNSQGKIYMADRDLVASEYSKINSKLNHALNCEVLLSNGFGNLQGLKFDVIVSNLPSHIAKEALMKILADASKSLNKGGKFYIVTTNKLRPFMERLLEPVFGKCETASRTSGYSVLLVRGLL